MKEELEAVKKTDNHEAALEKIQKKNAGSSPFRDEKEFNVKIYF